MAYEFNGGISTLTLRKPSQPAKPAAPDATKIFLHNGENAGKYGSFIEAVSDLAQAFKFLPKYDQLKYQYGSPTASTLTEYEAAIKEGGWTDDTEFLAETFSKQSDPKNANLIWGQGLGRAYSNLEFSPDASDWNLLDGVSTGSGQSFYQIAKSGVISTYTDEQAFELMCSMTESKERVFNVLYDIFGDSSNLTNDSAVITNISNWLSDYTEVDPHNLGILKMFFSMQTDFINTLSAYMNCETYWGGDLTTPALSSDLGDFSDTLETKVDSYISSLSGDAKDAAEALKTKWSTQPSRWDKVGDEWTGELVGTDGDFSFNTSGSWVEFFQDKMDEFVAKEVVRVISCSIMRRSADKKYKDKKAEYEGKKEDLILDEIFLNKMQAKK
ncbi:MAG: hypothetical protein ABH860_02100 [bacterium]